MAKDRYGSFEELSSAEIAGEDFSIVSKDRGTKALILAPHGGFIEPGTSQISRTVAATKYSLYIFEGLKNRKHSELHITSTSFDEPRAMELAEKSETIVSIHGRADRNDGETIWLGGLDKQLLDKIASSLCENGFKIASGGAELTGKNPRNICNRSKSGRGVQLEIPRSLRDRLVADTAAMASFSRALHQALQGL